MTPKTADKPFVVHWRCTGCGATGTAAETKTGEGGPHLKHLRSCHGGLETSWRGWGT